MLSYLTFHKYLIIFSTDSYISQIIPIPMIEQKCKKNCCIIRFCPLVLAFGRTIHTFQGQESGPGKPIESIIVNPGDRTFEIRNPGTLNCCITRATTLGDKKNQSALYFTGPHINYNRFHKMTYTKSGKLCENVQLREKWVNFLMERKDGTKEKCPILCKQQIEILKNEINSIKLSTTNIDDIILYHIDHIKKKHKDKL